MGRNASHRQNRLTIKMSSVINGFLLMLLDSHIPQNLNYFRLLLLPLLEVDSKVLFLKIKYT